MPGENSSISNGGENAKMKDNENATSYRPPQSFLDIFWLLSDGKTEEIRNGGAVKLSKLLQTVEVCMVYN